MYNVIKLFAFKLTSVLRYAKFKLNSVLCLIILPSFGNNVAYNNFSGTNIFVHMAEQNKHLFRFITKTKYKMEKTVYRHEK